MAGRKIVVVVVLLVLAAYFYAAHRTISIPVSAEFGYGGDGKYVLFYTDEPRVLEEVEVEGEVYKTHEIKATTRHFLRFNYEGGRSYSFFLRFKRAKGMVKARAPSIKEKLEASARFYLVNDGNLLVASYRIFSIENDGVFVTLLSKPLPREVCVLDYPTVLVSERDMKEFAEVLEKELKKYSIAVRKVRKPSCRGILVIANGALPKGYNFSTRAIYIGTVPGDVYISQEGVVEPGRILGSCRVIKSGISSSSSFPSQSKFQSHLQKLEFRSSSYYCDSENVILRRDDGKPGVFLLGNTLVFSSTISEGWESVEKAAKDCALAAVTGFFAPSKTESYALNGDARNISGIITMALPGGNGKDGKGDVRGLLMVSAGEGKLIKLIPAKPENYSKNIRISVPEKVRAGEEAVIRVYASPGEVVSGYMKVKIDGRVVKERFTVCRRACLEEIEVPVPYGRHILEVDFSGEKSFALLSTPRITATALALEPGERGRLVVQLREGEEDYRREATLFIDGIPVLREKGNGTLTYRGLLKPGSVVEVSAAGYRAKLVVPQKEEMSLILKAGAALFLFLVALSAVAALRFGKLREEATVEFPVPLARNAEELKPSEVVKVFELYNRRMRRGRLPLTAEEVVDALHTFGLTKDRASIKSVESALAELSRMPLDLRIVEHKGFYMPFTWMIRGDEGEHFVMLRKVYDFLVENGIPARILSGAEREVLAERNGNDRRKEKEKERKRGICPDIIAVTRKEVAASAFPQLRRALEEQGMKTVRLFIECETGTRRIRRIFEEKLEVLRPYWSGEEREKEKRAHDAFEVLIIVMGEDAYREYTSPGLDKKLGHRLWMRVGRLLEEGRLLVLPFRL